MIGGKMIGRSIGALLLFAALGAAGYEIFMWVASGAHEIVSAGGLWYLIHRSSLNAAQAITQRYLFPWLWDPAIAWVLVQPAWAVLGLPGLALAVICRPVRRVRGIFRKH